MMRIKLSDIVLDHFFNKPRRHRGHGVRKKREFFAGLIRIAILDNLFNSSQKLFDKLPTYR